MTRRVGLLQSFTDDIRDAVYTDPMSHHDDYFSLWFVMLFLVVTGEGGGGMLFNFVSEDVDSSSISSEDSTPSVNERDNSTTPSVNERDNSTTTKRKYSCVYT